MDVWGKSRAAQQLVGSSVVECFLSCPVPPQSSINLKCKQYAVFYPWNTLTCNWQLVRTSVTGSASRQGRGLGGCRSSKQSPGWRFLGPVSLG